MPRVAAAAVLDHDAVRLVLFVRLHARRARRVVERIGERAARLVAVGEEASCRFAPRSSSAMTTSRVGPRRSTICMNLRNAPSCSTRRSSSSPLISVPSGKHDDPRLDGALDQPGLERPLVADEGFRSGRVSPGTAAAARCRRSRCRRARASGGRRTSAAACGCAIRPRPRRS